MLAGNNATRALYDRLGNRPFFRQYITHAAGAPSPKKNYIGRLPARTRQSDP
ncbi:hypothetical protein MGWOODY_XGa1078 [hydrothermal vent metagenome]|uniref:Uncharacterized protein n=1 Tax=hydrothermal vent metagenome TaxID=652676 RepID=A0A160TV01_9ZZZZ